MRIFPATATVGGVALDATRPRRSGCRGGRRPTHAGRPAASGHACEVAVRPGLAGRAGERRSAGWDVGRVRSPEAAARLAPDPRASWASLVWMIGEGTLGLVAGVQGGSLSLVGWALGSVIEGLASAVVIWAVHRLPRPVRDRGGAGPEEAVAVSFFLLAPYLVVQAVRDQDRPRRGGERLLGLLVTAASVVVMPALGLASTGWGQVARARRSARARRT